MEKGSAGRVLLEVSTLSFRTVSGRTLFENLSFSLHAGQLLWITGSNGSGKSTLLKVLLGRMRPTFGKVMWSVGESERRGVPQLQNMDFHLTLTLAEVVGISQNRSVSTDEITGFGLLGPESLSLLWNTASGGERQRALLTCALMRRPKLLFLDEPFNHLDSLSRESLWAEISHLVNKAERSSPNHTVVLVSHEVHPNSGWLNAHNVLKIEFIDGRAGLA